MKYKVIKPFRDGQDAEQPYGLGGLYPREGYEPSDERVEHLIGLGYLSNPNAKDVADEKEVEPATEDVQQELVEQEVDEAVKAEEITEKNTKLEIMAFLDDLGVEYAKNDTKEELLALLDDYDVTSD